MASRQTLSKGRRRLSQSRPCGSPRDDGARRAHGPATRRPSVSEAGRACSAAEQRQAPPRREAFILLLFLEDSGRPPQFCRGCVGPTLRSAEQGRKGVAPLVLQSETRGSARLSWQRGRAHKPASSEFCLFRPSFHKSLTSARSTVTVASLLNVGLNGKLLWALPAFVAAPGGPIPAALTEPRAHRQAYLLPAPPGREPPHRLAHPTLAFEEHPIFPPASITHLSSRSTGEVFN